MHIPTIPYGRVDIFWFVFMSGPVLYQRKVFFSFTAFNCLLIDKCYMTFQFGGRKKGILLTVTASLLRGLCDWVYYVRAGFFFFWGDGVFPRWQKFYPFLPTDRCSRFLTRACPPNCVLSPKISKNVPNFSLNFDYSLA